MSTINSNEIEIVPKNNPLFQQCLNELKNLIEHLNIDSTTLHIIIKYTMEIVENTPLKGSEQKNFACRLIKEIFKNITDGEEEKSLVKLVDNGTIGNMIDLIIDASRGRLNVNTVTRASQGCLGVCLPYVFKQISKSVPNNSREKVVIRKN